MISGRKKESMANKLKTYFKHSLEKSRLKYEKEYCNSNVNHLVETYTYRTILGELDYRKKNTGEKLNNELNIFSDEEIVQAYRVYGRSNTFDTIFGMLKYFVMFPFIWEIILRFSAVFLKDYKELELIGVLSEAFFIISILLYFAIAICILVEKSICEKLDSK